MDLGAYIQKEGFEDILERNGIFVPRNRGMRMMKEEEPYTADDIHNLIEGKKDYAYGRGRWKKRWRNALCDSRYGPSISHMRRLMINDPELFTPTKNVHEIRKICRELGGRGDPDNGRNAKLAVSLYKSRLANQSRMWNSMCGKDVLYVHARIGCMWHDNEVGWTDDETREYIYHWDWHGSIRDKTKLIEQHPSFLGWCKDAFDETYCDIYFDMNKMI